ncbi:M14 family zinc carboxypeptidase [Noviherbaspirillum massiliense]|uniref:M14 family zinc carboxypeptidase n=1 Tax=Noviherbaspirillum massiliense TaxID=1465823 RepID=UPI001FE0FFEB|nr:M14 family zinc carboxypeptidase [Noviherbaspirillum massiliense]
MRRAGVRTVGLIARLVSCILMAGAGAGLPGSAAAAVAGTADPGQQSGWCKRLIGRLPGVLLANCEHGALVPTGSFSLKGFPLLARDFPVANDIPAKEPVRVLLLGGIHGDELTSSAIVFQWMQWMQGPVAQRFHWRVMPVVNPDGLLASKPQRMNANGVDLNRNFPTPGWQQEAPRYWMKTTRSDPRRFPGTTPLSEPESRWLHQEMERFRPHVIISVHAPFGVLDLDGPATPPRRFGRLLFNRVGVYPGSLGNYSGLHKKVPVVTIELPNAQAMPPKAEVQRIWQDMLGWIERNVPQKDTVPALRPVALSPVDERKNGGARP